MSPELDDLLSQALRLPAEARAALAASLLESLEEDGPDEEVEAAWKLEIARRLQEVDRGDVRTVPWADALRQLHGASRGRAG